jgi:hypothetical protein
MLTGWANYYILVIDSSKIDSTLSNFPIMIEISSNTGIGNFNATSVFDELTYANRKKIAVTDANDNQLYVEIESWDQTNEIATLWAKVPTIASGTDTTLYLYYDSSQSDNTTYVGDTTSTPGKAVWTTDYDNVWHLAQDPSGGSNAIKDSTNSANHGTSDGTMLTEDLVNSTVGKGLDFEGTDDEVNITSITIGASNTVTFACQADGTGTYHIMSGVGGAARFAISSTQFLYGFGVTYPTNYFIISHGVTITDPHVYTFTLSSDSKTLYLYVDGSYVDSIYNSTGGASISVWNIAGRDFASAWGFFDGKIDELRYSNTVLPAAQIKADHYSMMNQLINFVQFTFSNPAPADLSTVYGLTEQLQLTTTISGSEANYIYDATFYNALGDIQIGSTVSGTQSGQYVTTIMSTISGIDYQWYIIATSSGLSIPSSTYTFTNRFLCEGYVEDGGYPASGIPVRLYRRSTGELVGYDTTSGVSGTFSIPTEYNEYHYALALYSTDDTNLVAADWLIPS